MHLMRSSIWTVEDAFDTVLKYAYCLCCGMIVINPNIKFLRPNVYMGRFGLMDSINVENIPPTVLELASRKCVRTSRFPYQQLNLQGNQKKLK